MHELHHGMPSCPVSSVLGHVVLGPVSCHAHRAVMHAPSHACTVSCMVHGIRTGGARRMGEAACTAGGVSNGPACACRSRTTRCGRC